MYKVLIVKNEKEHIWLNFYNPQEFTYFLNMVMPNNSGLEYHISEENKNCEMQINGN